MRPQEDQSFVVRLKTILVPGSNAKIRGVTVTWTKRELDEVGLDEV